MGYIVKSAYHHFSIMGDREPIKNVLKSNSLTTSHKKKLQLITKVKKFSEQYLGLKETSNYQHFVQLKTPYVSYLLTVSKKYELKAHEWYFPIIGKVPYKGFPSPKEAKKEAQKFSHKEYDIYIRGVSAYSTLG